MASIREQRLEAMASKIARAIARDGSAAYINEDGSYILVTAERPIRDTSAVRYSCSRCGRTLETTVVEQATWRGRDVAAFLTDHAHVTS